MLKEIISALTAVTKTKNHRRLLTILSMTSLFTISSHSYAETREPAVAGQFYPSDKNELTKTLHSFFAKVAIPDIKGEIKALLVPHAGYAYSGQTAAYAYKLLKNNSNVKTVIIIGNSHLSFLDKGAVFASGSFETPIGNVPVNSNLARSILSKTNMLSENYKPHADEHSIEVQIPFLQETLSNFDIVPILLSSMPIEDTQDIAKSISEAIKEQGIEDSVLIIASSDMSHYPSWANANMVDAKSLETLTKFDPRELQKDISNSMRSSVPSLACVFCAEESLYTMMYTAKFLGADTANVLNYTNSGEITGDHSKVVGYSSAVFYKSTHDVVKERKGSEMTKFEISEANQKILLQTARNSIEYFLKNKTLAPVTTNDSALKTPSAVFVTLTIDKNLRGCIGTTEPQAPLIDVVNQMAISAAFHDHRFGALTQHELNKLKIEISVLSPMQRVTSPDQIEQGTHGVMVKAGNRSGLFLPQVWEHFHDKKDFMNELCSQKAGLEPSAWNDPKTELSIFTVFAFEEQ